MATSPSPSPSRTAGPADLGGVDLVLVAALAALGGLGFVAAFRLDDLVQPVVAAAVAGVAVSLVVTGLAGRGVTTALLVAVPVLAAVAVVAGGIDAGALVPGLRDGPRTILTSAVPAPGLPELLMVPFAATALAGLLGAELAQRSRLAIAPTMAPLAVFVVGLAFGGEGRLPPLWIPTAWVLLAALLTGWRAGGSDAEADVPVVSGRHSRGRSARRGSGRRALPSVRGLATVVLVAVPLAGCARWLGPHLPGAEQRERFDLRGLVDPPARDQQVANPLIAVTAWQDGPDDPLFTADTSAPVDRWRLAVLDAYDGVEWRSSAGFVAAGTDLPGPLVTDDSDDSDGSGGSGGDDEVDRREVTETVEPTGLGGRWLPVVDRAVEVSTPGTLFDRAGGVLLVDGAELPERYTVRSAVPEPDPDRLVGAAVADDDEARATLALPDGVPDDVGALADEIVKGTGSAYARAAAIERYLAASPGVPYELATEDLPSGHSIGHLRCFLFAPERCARRGSTEQFVAAYALLARAAGLPTRVVVGFEAARTEGRTDVTAHDATAWAEVKLAGVGWVAFDPVPDPTVEITP
ncbi:MAG TPA: transglutaminaseTgpA domain-containing protein, partial [Acidimicrobiales bacterium]|nr:transglutaminaseTgpA domain-containing protein [Acidimicrobiales bacterium]